MNPKTDTFEQSSSQGNSTIKRVYNARVVFEFPKRTLKELAEKGMKQWLSERKFNEGRIVSTYPIE